ncbi:MAG TPA: hypothetical protein VF042_04290 [Gemmatimonadaceae bacterium]
MKKFLGLLFIVAACAPKVTTKTTTAPVEPSTPVVTEQPRASNETGGATARSAVEQFLAAARAGDLQAMSVTFGTKNGPSRDNMSRDELEKRLVILQCYFNHDKSRILGESPGESGHRIIEAELTKQGISRTPNFYAIQGPGSRWYVDNMEIAAVRDFCRKTSGT